MVLIGRVGNEEGQGFDFIDGPETYLVCRVYAWPVKISGIIYALKW